MVEVSEGLLFRMVYRLFVLELFQECWRDSHVHWNADSVPPPSPYPDSFLGLHGFPNPWILWNDFLPRKSCL